jgi:N-acetylglucosamine-6-phosphate deacetylase
LNLKKNGIHNKSILQTPHKGLASLEACYGADNLDENNTPVKYVTIAPEQPGALDAITELHKRGIIVSLGHTAANYEQAFSGIIAGASMITHLFNAMEPLHHRNPGLFGLLGQSSTSTTTSSSIESKEVPKPFFGLIADGIHLHPSAINIAWNAHPQGCILVTDAMALAGCPDGVYDWTNGSRIRKQGYMLTLEPEGDVHSSSSSSDGESSSPATSTGSNDAGKIAGSSITLIECVNNFWNWSGVGVAQALGAVTATPARMLGLENTKGCLKEGADADLVVLEEVMATGDNYEVRRELVVVQVWKFGKCVFDCSREVEA